MKYILVTGGQTGRKLHSAHSGSSCLSCGHWTKTAVTRFQVADNIEPETLEKFKNDGFELCEKCFPQYADTQIKKYTGPKYHLKNLRPELVEGRILAKLFRGSACGRKVDYLSKFNDFKKAYKEDPDKCCKGCTKRMFEIMVQVQEMKIN